MKAQKITGKILLLLVLIAAMTSCLSPTPVVQVYPGPKLERAEIAVVTVDPTLGVIYVNRVDPLPGEAMRTMTLQLLPGKYIIQLWYSDGYLESTRDEEVMLFAEAGKSYHIYSGAGGGSWLPYVEQKY